MSRIKAGKSHPIVMQGFNINAIRQGKKSQTRRAVRPQPDIFFDFGEGLTRTQIVEWKDFSGSMEEFAAYANPYGQVGDKLWVRETWRIVGWDPLSFDIQYQSDGEVREELMVNEEFKESTIERYYQQCEDECAAAGLTQFDDDGEYMFSPDEAPTQWRSARFMPKWTSRMTLEITEPIRVERVQDISDEECLLEGVELPALSEEYKEMIAQGYWVPKPSLISEYAIIWDTLNNKRGFPWGKNPWVYVLSFKSV